MEFSRKKIVSGTMLLAIGQGSDQLFSLLKNAIYGHFLSPDDFGVAAIFTITISVIDMVTNMGASKLLIQSKEKNITSLQNTIHFYTVIIGVISAFIVFFVSPYLAQLFKIEDVGESFYLLSGIVFLNGFLHLDVKRLQRDLNFSRFVLSELIPQVISVLLAYPLILHFKNYKAVIYILFIHALFHVLMTHLFSKNKYRLEVNKYFFKKIFKFGGPLVLNGMLMFFIFQGDKLVIGAEYNLKILGIYSAIFMITMAPAMLILKILTNISLPLFSNYQDDIEQLSLNYSKVVEITVFTAFILSGVFIIFGDFIVAIVFGNQYQGNSTLISILSIMWSFRIIRGSPTLLAMSKGNTKITLAANVLRSIAILGVLWLAMNKASVELIALCGCGGELLAIIFSVYKVSYRFGVSSLHFLVRFFLFCLFISSLFGLDFYYNEIAYTSLLFFIFVTLFLFFFTRLLRAKKRVGVKVE